MIYKIILLALVASFAYVESSLVQIDAIPQSQPYQFGYSIKDLGSQQYREETGDGVSGVTGSYGFTDANGIQRQVNYLADGAGFRAQVKTNEPGTANQNPAAVEVISNPSVVTELIRPVANPSIQLLNRGINNGILNNGLLNRGLVTLNSGDLKNRVLNSGFLNRGLLNNNNRLNEGLRFSNFLLGGQPYGIPIGGGLGYEYLNDRTILFGIPLAGGYVEGIRIQ